MSSDYTGKKLADLKVCDLKVELEKRDLETTGVKPALAARLEKALVDEGHDPSVYIFVEKVEAECVEQEPNVESHCDSEKKDDDSKADANAKTDVHVTENDEESGEEPVIELTETSNNEIGIECDNDNDQEHLQLTVIDSDKLDTSNIDNEDSLNLTIGEEEAKIFQDEETDEKVKESNTEEKSNGSDTAKSSSSAIAMDGKNGSGGSVGGNSTSFKNNPTSKKDDGTSAGNDTNELADGDNVVQANDDDNNAGGNGGGTTKGDESETKTSPSKSSKDDKEPPSKATNNLSSSSSAKASSAPVSRNLWVSGLSSLTRATDLKIIFSKYGKVIGAKVVTNTRTPGTRCFGYVTMNSSTDATKCITNLHRTELHGRIISVERAKSDIANIGNKPKRAPSAQETKAADDEKKMSQAAVHSERPKKAKEDESAEKVASSSNNNNNNNNNNSNNSSASSNANTNNSKPPVTKEKPTDGGSESSKASTVKVVSGAEDATTQSDAGSSNKTGKETSSHRSDAERSTAKRASQSDRVRRPTDADLAARRERKRERDRAVLSFRKIKEERERARMRERERKLREEERHRAAERRRQRDEEERLQKERNKLREERSRLEREKADLLRLQRERQKLEREKIELERLELKRQQLKIEEARRAMKRPPPDNDRYNDVDRKRSSNDRRFDPPPPPKISIYPTNSTKRNDDYKSTSRSSNNTISSVANDCRGGSEITSSFKRPMTDGYSKRSNDIEPQPRSTSGYDQRGSVSQMGSSGKDHRFNESDNRGGSSNFARHRLDDRDSRGAAPPRKSRYMDSHSNGNSNDRYDRQQSSSTPAWNNGLPPSVKSFNVPNDPWGTMGKVPQNQESNNWGRMDNQNQERYDRTYNERNPKYMDGNANASNSGNRPSSFIANSRAQDRYNNMPNRFDGGRF